jgi:hypothetical protein
MISIGQVDQNATKASRSAIWVGDSEVGFTKIEITQVRSWIKTFAIVAE